MKNAAPQRRTSMPHFANWIAFALVALGMVLTPGPNMIYLVSRSICQGPAAGLVSLGGVALGFVFYMLSAALGVTALVIAVLPTLTTRCASPARSIC
jgi:threonine/homoserine/homoserine lactone efflux protein